MSGPEYLVALINATTAAIPPAVEALEAQFPEAKIWNLLDDRLLQDASDAGGLTQPLEERMRRLIGHAVDGGADAVLLTCSMYGPVVHRMPIAVPAVAPDEAAFAQAASGRYARVLIVASLESALVDSMERFTEQVADSGRSVVVQGIVVPAAFDAAKAADRATMVAALAEECRPLLGEIDAILLAQYSLALAQSDLQRELGKPVISGPQTAALDLRTRLTAQSRTSVLGAIADDYTGGTDLALTFSQAGLRTLLFFGSPPRDVELPTYGAMVVALKSRTIPSAEAIGLSLEAFDWLARKGVERFYFKYCSTFDSTSGGNIGPVLDALADAVGVGVVLTTPSSPQHRRTVYAGRLFVDSTLLAESHMARHPLTPMTDSNILRILGAQTTRRVSDLSLSTVHQGISAVREVMDRATHNGVGYLVADAVDERDLFVLASAVADQPLVAGAAGLAGALARVHDGSRRHSCLESSSDQVGRVRAAVLAGSCSTRTLEQIDHFKRHGHPSYRVNALSTGDPEKLAQQALSWIDELDPDATPLLYSSLPATELRKVQQEIGAFESAELLESALSQIARGLVHRGVRRIISAGGEVSGAIVDALKVQGAVVGGSVSAGVPWIYTLEQDPLALLLKSGNFGDVAIFTRAVDPDLRWGVQT